MRLDVETLMLLADLGEPLKIQATAKRNGRSGRTTLTIATNDGETARQETDRLEPGQAVADLRRALRFHQSLETFNGEPHTPRTFPDRCKLAAVSFFADRDRQSEALQPEDPEMDWYGPAGNRPMLAGRVLADGPPHLKQDGRPARQETRNGRCRSATSPERILLIPVPVLEAEELIMLKDGDPAAREELNRRLKQRAATQAQRTIRHPLTPRARRGAVYQNFTVARGTAKAAPRTAARPPLTMTG